MENSDAPPRLGAAVRAHLVHLYTASGVAFAFAAVAELCSPNPNVRLVFALLVGALLVDATDGPLARRFHVKQFAPRIDGRTIDDIVDYLTFTFIPLLLMWRMNWLPQPGIIWVVPALIASLFGFANQVAKDEVGGFFLGFPSYWNIVAFYAGIWAGPVGNWVNAAMLLILAVLTVLPVRFLYPNLTPRPWKVPVLAGAFLWLLLLVWMLLDYPRVSGVVLCLSLVYPLFYTALSWRLAARPAAR